MADHSTCLQNEFNCTNGLCINSSRVCDGSDDCGDFSDEIICGKNLMSLKYFFFFLRVLFINLEKNCKRSISEQWYIGKKNISTSGKPCLPWKDMVKNFKIPHRFPDETIAEAENFCRNPTNKTLGPWCFVDSVNWEYCDIKKCKSRFPYYICFRGTNKNRNQFFRIVNLTNFNAAMVFA